MSSDRIAQEGHAPTPFTAEEIRAHCPNGLRLTIAVRGEGRVTYRTSTFRNGDDDAVTLEDCPSAADGTPTGEVTGTRATWTELQAHASFPADRTTVGEETITGPLGTLACRRYDVRTDSGTRTFWFALDHPGMPVRSVSAGLLVEVVDRTVLP